jgi:hypothetical protein
LGFESKAELVLTRGRRHLELKMARVRGKSRL